SRIALAIAAVAGGETLVFDEIDAGIGGETANAVGRVLRRLAERAQVITITHLPQIAALAERHFVVEKVPGDPTHTRIGQLPAERLDAELELEPVDDKRTKAVLTIEGSWLMRSSFPRRALDQLHSLLRTGEEF